MIPEHIVESRASNYGFVLHSPCFANLDSEFFCSDFSDSLPIPGYTTAEHRGHGEYRRTRRANEFIDMHHESDQQGTREFMTQEVFPERLYVGDSQRRSCCRSIVGGKLENSENGLNRQTLYQDGKYHDAERQA